MNKDTIEGSWKQLKGKMMAQWGKFTGNQLEELDAKGVEASGKLQEGYGAAKDAVEKQGERLKESGKK